MGDPFNSLIKRRIQEIKDSPRLKVWREFNSKVYYGWVPYFFERFSGSLPRNSVVLDFGCGEGQYLIQFVNKNNNWHGVGVDISLESIQRAFQNSIKNELKHRIDLIQADVNYPPFRDGSFDGALVIDVFHHLLSLSSVRQLYRITKERGKLLVIDLPMTNPLKFLGRKMPRCINFESLGYGRSFLFFSSSLLNRAICRSGFKILEEDYRGYFFGFVGILLIFFPFLAQFLSKNVLIALYRIEEWMRKAPGIHRTNLCVIFLCERYMR